MPRCSLQTDLLILGIKGRRPHASVSGEDAQSLLLCSFCSLTHIALISLL